MDYSKISNEIRKEIVKMIFKSKAPHIGSAFSCVDILAVLYFKILNINPKKPGADNRDRFILSKGHAASALYATLAQRGFFPKKLLSAYCSNGGKMFGHSVKDCVPGAEASTGSLGHGLPMGAGMALAAKKDNKGYRVFVLMSDGECQEGSVWETALFSSHHKLDNLVAIVDYNQWQCFGKTNEVLNLEPFKEKWISFGWEVKEINGHNSAEIEKTLSRIPFKKDKPNMIIAHTIKGKGASFMEDTLEWHFKTPSEDECRAVVKELNKK